MAKELYCGWIGMPKGPVLNPKCVELRECLRQGELRTNRIQKLAELKEISEMVLLPEVVHELAIRDAMMEVASTPGRMKAWRAIKEPLDWTSMNWEEFYRDMVELANKCDEEMKRQKNRGPDRPKNRVNVAVRPRMRMEVNEDDEESCACGKLSDQEHHRMDCEVFKVLSKEMQEKTRLFWKERRGRSAKRLRRD